MSERSPIELDPGSIDVDLAEIKSRSVRGLVALTSRTFLIYIFSTIATFALTVLLSPQEYGVFFLVSAVINFLTYFSDIGLAAALIQKKTQLTSSELTTTFTIQQLLVVALVLLVLGLTPVIRRYYSLTDTGVWLLWSLALSFLLSSLKTIPTALLERELAFDKLILPQIAENIVYNTIVVFLAWRGFGVTSFAVAVLARGIIGLVLIYWVKPWRPRLGIDRQSLQGLLKFGLPYQTNSLLAVIKDDGMTLFLGGIIGQVGLGYLGWANKWVQLPLRFIMDNVTKVAFPAYARIQHDTQLLKRGVEKVLYFMALITFPIFTGMGLLAAPVISLIPRYSQWLPALIPLYMYLINAAWAAISTPLTNTLNAIGQIKTTFKLMLMWTGLTWILMPMLGIKFGYQGVSLAAALIAFSSVAVLLVTARYIKLDYIKIFRGPILASVVMGLAVKGIMSLEVGLLGVFSSIGLGAVIYASSMLALDRKLLIAQIQSVRKHL